MANNFLEVPGSEELSDGSTDIFAATLSADNLLPSFPLKTNSARILISTKLDISDIDTLQNQLTEKNTLDFIENGTPAVPPTDRLRMYAKSDKKMYIQNDAGLELQIQTGSASSENTWNFNTSTVGPPSSGEFLYDNATPASVTSIQLHEINSTGGDARPIISTLNVGDQIYFENSDQSNAKLYTITASPVDNTTYFTFPVALENQNDTANYSNGESIMIGFYPQTTTLQNSYNVSMAPHIETNDASGTIVFKRGTSGDDDVVFSIDDASNQSNFFVTGSGHVQNAIIGAQHSTGILTGGNLSIGSTPLLFNVSAGTGIIVDPASGAFTHVEWPDIIDKPLADFTIGTDISSNLYFDPLGTLQRQFAAPTNTQKRNFIYIGGLAHPDLINIVVATTIGEPAIMPANSIQDLATAIGVINVSGNLVSSNSLLTIARSTGIIFSYGANWSGNIKNPHTKTTAAMDSSISDTFVIAYRDPGNPLEVDIKNITATSVIPSEYDNGTGSGTPGVVANNNWQNMRVIVTIGGDTFIMPGQDNLYSSLGDALGAISNESFQIPFNLASGAVAVAVITCKGNETDLSSANARISQLQKFGTSASGSSVSTMQNTYDNSGQPAIATNDSHGSIQYKRGTTGGDADLVHEILNGSDVSTYSVSGNGDVLSNKYNNLFMSEKNTRSVAIGVNAGATTQSTDTIAIGGFAGETTQQSSSIAIGPSAGRTNQGINAISIGNQAGFSQQKGGAIAIGNEAGDTTQNDFATAVGFQSGQYYQGNSSVAIGNLAGQGVNTVGEGLPDNSIALGIAAFDSAAEKAGPVDGNGVARTTPGIWIGTSCARNATTANALFYDSATGEIVYGANTAGNTFQTTYDNSSQVQILTDLTPKAIQFQNGATNVDSVLQILTTSGSVAYDFTTDSNIRLGVNAGVSSGTSSVSIGASAGQTSQGSNCIAIGGSAGLDTMANQSIAIGTAAARNTPLGQSVSIGTNAGLNTAGFGSVAIGLSAGQNRSGTAATCIGDQAGVGVDAVNEGIPGSSIAIGFNAFDSALEKSLNGGVPRTIAGTWIGTGCIQNKKNANILYYNTTTGEITQDVKLVANSVTTTATLTPDAELYEQEIITALASALTVAAPIGALEQGQRLTIRITDNGTGGFAINWNAIYRPLGVVLPALTVASTPIYIGCIYNANDVRWDVVSVV